VSEWITYQSSNQSMHVKVARCFAFLGPYLPLNKHFAIGNFIQSALLNENIEIKGDGTPLRTYLYTSDLCIWLLKILINGSPNCIYNVGGGEILSIRELADIVREQLNSSVQVNVHQLPCGIVDAYIPNLDKISSELGLHPTIPVREAINKTANWNKKYAAI
jgi:nucleoside-diphosphate-sugar epimerase